MSLIQPWPNRFRPITFELIVKIRQLIPRRPYSSTLTITWLSGVNIATGKSYSEMLSMEDDIQADLDTGTAPDPEFYSAILRRMVLHKAKARLRELHAILQARSKSEAINEANVPKAMGWREEVTYPSTIKTSLTLSSL